MRRIRRITKILFTRDPEHGTRQLGGSQTEHTLDDQGGIETVEREEIRFLDCGCVSEPAGRCRCGQIMCSLHIAHCVYCFALTCGNHGTRLDRRHECVCDLCAEELLFDRSLKRAASFAIAPLKKLLPK